VKYGAFVSKMLGYQFKYLRHRFIGLHAVLVCMNDDAGHYPYGFPRRGARLVYEYVSHRQIAF
jgi:hypothetical protein